MSDNHPLYNVLRKLDHPGAWWWRMGDITYYIGVIPAFLFGAGSIVAFVGMLARWNDWRVPAKTASLFVFCVLIAVCGSMMRRHAFRLAERDGITEETDTESK